MSRREFTKQTKRDALKRARSQCEGTRPDGARCSATLTVGKFHFDHVIADALGGQPTLDNCAVLCHACHAEKTDKRDKPAIAEAVRRSDAHLGIRTAPVAKIRSAPFARSEKAMRRMPKPSLPYRPMFVKDHQP